MSSNVNSLNTPEQIERYRLVIIRSAIRIYLKTGMLANTAYTPANLRKAVSDLTLKKYKRSREGLEAALADLNAHIEALDHAKPDQ